jgi:phage terminase large subunit-like protein
MTSSERVIFIDEPQLRVGHDQRCEYVKDGLFAFGPLQPLPGKSALRFGVIGTEAAHRRFDKWAESIRCGIRCDEEKAHRMSWPGFGAVFESEWPQAPLARVTIDGDRVLEAIRRRNRREAVYEAVGLFADAIVQYLERDELRPDFWFVVIDEEVWKLGRPEQSVSAAVRTESNLPMTTRAARTALEGGARLLFPEWQEAAERTLEVEGYEVNFHNQLKARLIAHHTVVQILRETTIAPLDFVDAKGRPKRRVDDPATIAWNVCTTAFFKAQGKPWQLEGVRPGVCYVGLVFKQLPQPSAAANACCGAQMFLNSGDGVVFKGVEGNWYESESKEYHLSEEKARELMSLVLENYRWAHEQPPAELFIHGQTRFNDAEWKGFQAAVPAATALSGIRIRKSMDSRLYQAEGSTPVLRGVALVLSPAKGLLWSRGYVPRLQTYPGWEVPSPIEVEICRGTPNIDQVLADVFGLTKLNYNACIYADGMPVTLRFAHAVGEILTSIPRSSDTRRTEDYRPLPFRYYI